MELAYTFTNGWIKKLGLSYMKLYLNGNNLWVWSRMPDDRESNFSEVQALVLILPCVVSTLVLGSVYKK